MLKSFFRNPLRPSFRRYAHCLGCGTEFQFVIPDTPGFQYHPSSGVPKIRPENITTSQAESAQTYEKILGIMSAEQKMALKDVGPEIKLGDNSITPLDLRNQREKAKESTKKNYCRYCLGNRNGNSAFLQLPTESALAASTTSEDSQDKTFHVIDAVDFPFGVPKTWSGGKIVLNRVDLIVRHASQVSRFKEYAMQYMPRGVLARDIVCTSAVRGWGLQRLSEMLLSGENKFVGRTCSGKTSLALALAGQPLHGGAWPLPFQTQFPQMWRTLPMFRSKRILDMPSFPEAGSDGLGIWPLVIPKFRRKLVEGRPLFGSNPKYAGFNVKVRPGHVASIGGLMGLEIPRSGEPGSTVHLFASIGAVNAMKARSLSSVQKIEEINASDAPQHADWLLAEAKGIPLQPLAKIELAETHSIVVRGLGVIQPMVFGRWPEGCIATVYGLPGIEVMLRQNVQPWLFRVPPKSATALKQY